MMTRDKMMKMIQDAIEEADIDVEMSGFKNEHAEELELEKWELQDPDAVVNNILGVISDYLSDVL